ncbi:hypothetical protein EON63_24950, partial [archaeon]
MTHYTHTPSNSYTHIHIHYLHTTNPYPLLYTSAYYIRMLTHIHNIDALFHTYTQPILISKSIPIHHHDSAVLSTISDRLQFDVTSVRPLSLVPSLSLLRGAVLVADDDDYLTVNMGMAVMLLLFVAACCLYVEHTVPIYPNYHTHTHTIPISLSIPIPIPTPI